MINSSNNQIGVVYGLFKWDNSHSPGSVCKITVKKILEANINNIEWLPTTNVSNDIKNDVQKVILPIIKDYCKILSDSDFGFEVSIENSTYGALTECRSTVGGLSAGLPIAIAMISAAYGIPILSHIAATGQISSSNEDVKLGDISNVFLEGKLQACKNFSDVETILIPSQTESNSLSPEANMVEANRREIEQAPKNIKIIQIKNLAEGLAHSLDKKHFQRFYSNKNQLYKIDNFEQIKQIHDRIEIEKEICCIPSPPNPYFHDEFLLMKYFSGRVQQRNNLSEWYLNKSNNLMVIHGFPQIGKSSLAWVWLIKDVIQKDICDFNHDPETVSDCYPIPEEKKPGGIIWYDFSKIDNTFHVFLRKLLFYACHKQPLYFDILDADLYFNVLKKLLANEHFLIILDGLDKFYMNCDENVSEEDQSSKPNNNCRLNTSRLCDEFLEWAVSGSHSNKILVTQQTCPQDLLKLNGCVNLDLKNLSYDEAIDFFEKQEISCISSEVEKICNAYGRHPSCLQVLASHIKNNWQQPSDITSANSFDLFRSSDNSLKDLTDIAIETYDKLCPNKKEIVNILSTFRTSLPFERLFSYLDNYNKKNTLSKEKIEHSLNDLQQIGLIYRSPQSTKIILQPTFKSLIYNNLDEKMKSVLHINILNFLKSLNSSDNLAINNVDDSILIVEQYYHAAKSGLYDEAYKLFKKIY